MKLQLPPDGNDLLDPKTKAHMQDQILLSPITRYVLPTFLLATLLLIGVHIAMLFLTINDDLTGTCEVAFIYQVNCLPGETTTYKKCTEIGCCFDETTNGCYHTLPSRYIYAADETDPNVLRPKEKKSPLGSENKPVTVRIGRINAEHCQINLTTLHQIQSKYNAEIENMEVRESFLDGSANNPKSIQLDYDVKIHPEFSVTFTRGNATVMTTSRGPLIITETYWEWSLFLSNFTVYGLNSAELNGTHNWLYNNEDSNVIPGFLGIANDGTGVGCYIEYKGPMEVEVLQSNLIILRGMSMPATLSIHVFTGGTLKDVTKQFSLLSKQQSSEFTISSLGLHICPEEEQELAAVLENLSALIDNMEDRGIPWDSHCIHRKFYPTLDQFLNANDEKMLNEVQRVLDDRGKTIVHHISNACSYGKSNLSFQLAKLSLLLETIHGPYVGKSENESIVYPNWMADETLKVYDTVIHRYIQASHVSKALYLRDLWPRDDSNFSTNFNKFDYVPQQLRTLMSKGSIPIELLSSTAESHYKIHNGYSKRFQCFIGKYVHAMEVDIGHEAAPSDWITLKKILKRGIASGLLGQLPSAIYMCSVTSPTSVDLCQRWYGVGVVFPNILAVPQNVPGGAWLSIGTSNYVTKLLTLRASLLTYQHSTITNYYISGSPILSPSYFHYPDDDFLKHLENQFMWGVSILVGVVTLPKTFQVQMHIPGACPWRHLLGGLEVQPTGGNSTSITVLEGEIITLLRPGHIIPFHEKPASTSANIRRSFLKLIGNVGCTGSKDHAEGRIFYKGSAYLSVIIDDTILKLKSIFDGDAGECSNQTTVLISSLEILGRESQYNIGLNVSFCEVGERICTLPAGGGTTRNELEFASEKYINVSCKKLE